MSNGKMKGIGAVGAVVTIALCIAGGAYNGFTDNVGKSTSSSSNQIVNSKKVTTTSEGNKAGSFTITDSTGQKVTFKEQPSRIVVLDPDAYTIIKMLGGSDKVVGVSKMMSTTPGQDPKGAVVAGTWQDPNVEKILSLKAQVVFCYAQYTNANAVKQLEAAGVKVVYINGDSLSTLTQDVTAVGQILGAQDKAKQFNDIANKYITMVKSRVAKIPADKRVSVYLEEYGKDQTAGKGSAAQALLSAAGLNNIAENDGQFATVNNSWILSQNPDMIVKIEADGEGVLGQGVTNTDKAKAAYNTLVSREGWNNLKAVKDGNVYLMDNNLAFSDSSAIAGMLYLAKWAYPNEFKDVNPAEVQNQINQEFFGTSTPAGTYVYHGSK